MTTSDLKRAILDESDDLAGPRRIVACVNALAGVSTEALEKLAALDDAHRFGALSDIAKLHHLKASQP